MMKNTEDMKLWGNPKPLEVDSLIETELIENTESKPASEKLEVDLDKISSPTLVRLIEEVRNEEELSVHAYNRMHNRHNRSR